GLSCDSSRFIRQEVGKRSAGFRRQKEKLTAAAWALDRDGWGSRRAPVLRRGRFSRLYPTVKRGMTSCAKRRIEASASLWGIVLKLTCKEACSNPPNSCCKRAIVAAISPGEPTQAPPDTICSAALEARSAAMILS